MQGGVDFVVNRGNLRDCKFLPHITSELAVGQVLLRIDKLGFTANNVTYAVFGDAMRYWAFFPVEQRHGDGWGRIPAWGYGTVIESHHEALPVGERAYGYLPMSTYVVLRPERVSDQAFVDASLHRAQLPAAYQDYRRIPAATDAAARQEDVDALLKPLFMTSFLIDDFFSSNDQFGARRIVIASASSKTALGLAFLLKQRGKVEVIGLTSAANGGFCERVGYYDLVLRYEDLRELPASEPAAFVDMAGSGRVLHEVHHHFGDQLRYSCIVGATHWQERSTQHNLPGAQPVFFFAPDHQRRRAQDLAPQQRGQTFAEAWRAFGASVATWLEVEHSRGEEAVRNAYLEVLDGRAPPQRGHILSLAPHESSAAVSIGV
jgi:hypothetical protein